MGCADINTCASSAVAGGGGVNVVKMSPVGIDVGDDDEQGDRFS